MPFDKEQANHPINQYGKEATYGKGLGAKGKEKFKPSGTENLGGNASQQPTQSKEKHSKPGEEDVSMNAGEHLWKETHSFGKSPNTPGAGL